jgi:homoserine O-acetyltransferase/O-succinyltransferase
MVLNKHPQAKVYVHHEPFQFETPYLGQPEIIPVLEVGYEAWGDPRHPAVLVCHALSLNTHATDLDYPHDPRRSWWNAMVGPGCAIDTNRFFVICINMLGGCGGTSGPASLSPETGEPYGLHFPIVTIGDMVRSQKILLEHLGVKRLHAVIGGSLGGYQALVWPILYPDFVENAICMGTGGYSNQFQIMTNRAQIDAIQLDANYLDGSYKPGHEPNAGLSIAREIGFCTFISPIMMEKKFAKYHASPREPYTDAAFHMQRLHDAEEYLRHQAWPFGRDFDANSMIYLLQTWNHFDLAVWAGSLAKAFDPVQARMMIIAATGDNLFPPYLSEDIVKALRVNEKFVRYDLIEDDYGHDFFLIPEIIQDKLTRPLMDFLSQS